ncbi:hypothetical protein N7481_012246 [Penicillium waksmanii]|uniref:uncharacterized protein n=1 Tax=Penicillium waksmanii TaxID=69791 RepID=UPI002547B337|nr:uncharacterized protein N7481_012246 [Penicillium waksmanii]KAJ5965532.1 hypothetical protein N7481_012246 [Penicillium waksmanii]
MNSIRKAESSPKGKVAQDFISTHASEHHEAFQRRAYFDTQRQQYVEWAPHRDLAAALERHRENGDSCFDTAGKCTWADVLDEMSMAEEEYFAKGRGSKNIGRRAFRKAGDYASSISPWFNLVPDDDGMNVLSGGLRLVFQIAREQAEAREKILKTFRDFVTILDATQIKRQIFRSNGKLRSFALDLYEAVLVAMTKLIHRLNRHHWWERASAPASAPVSSAAIDDILFDVNKRLNDVHRCLDDIRDQRLNSVHQNVVSSQTELHAVRLNTKTIEIDVRNLNDDFNHFAQQAQVDQEKIDSIQSGVERINENIDRLLTEHTLDAKTGLYHMLLDTIRGTAPICMNLLIFKFELTSGDMISIRAAKDRKPET